VGTHSPSDLNVDQLFELLAAKLINDVGLEINKGELIDLAQQAPQTGPEFSRFSEVIRAPVFVVGSPRSGTTITGSCLQAHPQLAGTAESLALIHLWCIYADLYKGFNRRRYCPLKEYISEDLLLSGIGDLADGIFAGVLGARKDRYVDHTPWYGACMPFIRSLYRDAVFIHVIRDGRQVVRSLTSSKERGFPWAGKTLKERTQLWMELVSIVKRFGSTLPAEQYLEVRYEELCANPEGTIGVMLEFLGLDWSDQCLIPLTKPLASPSRPDAVIAVLNGQGKVEFAPRGSESQWPEGWSSTARNMFWELAGPLMNCLGYDLSSYCCRS
jgi:Sulfotransferase family